MSPDASSTTPAPAPRPATLVALQTLERVSRGLLVELLTPHAAFFASHGIAMDALAATAQTDRALVRRVHDALHAPEPRAPGDELAALAIALHSLATSKGRDAILALDATETETDEDGAPRSPRFPRGTLSNEDLAASALLRTPELAEEALEECAVTADDAQPRGTTELEPADDRRLACDADFLARFASAFGAEMDARDRTAICDVHKRETATAVHLEIAHGKVPAARDFVRPKGDALALEQSTDVVTERAHARLCKLTGRLSLKAAHPAIKEVLRRTLGVVAFGDPDHWRADATCSLAAFSSFDAALAPDGIPGLASVELHRFVVLAADQEAMDFSRPRKSLVHTSAKELHDAALRLGPIVHVRLLLKLESGAKVTVKLTVKHGDNRIDYARDDAEVDRVVREYLIARGVMRLDAEPLAATA